VAKRKRLFSREIEHRLVNGIGVPVEWRLIRILKRTWKINWINVDVRSTKPAIFSIYHGDLVVAAWELPYVLPKVSVLTSRSRDGTVVAHFVHMFKGAVTIRGGSSRGAETALLQMRRALKAGRVVVIPIDGPRGPEGRVKIGVISVASKTGAPIIPGAVRTNSAWRFKSWDRMMLCKPFARVDMVYGEPFYVPPDQTREQLEEHRKRLEEVMREMHQGTH
jgi:lysophospholipid acyltransferase (LPLAT)-like uncharacterized protein